jgi:outer membrane protein assembly factor BamB
MKLTFLSGLPSKAVFLLGILHAGAGLLRSEASEWPSFRGPQGTGAAPDASIPAELKIRWSTPLQGRGLSSPVVSRGRVFLTVGAGESQEQLHVLCFQRDTGALLWDRQLRATGRTMTHSKTCVAANTPCTDGSRVFALWSSNDLAAFDYEGNLLWIRGLTADYSNASNSLGMASSLVVSANTLVVMIENDSESYALGVDANTGRNRWKLQRPKSANWSSPVLLPRGNGKSSLVILQSPKTISLVEVDTGKVFADLPMGGSSMSSPVVEGETAYLASSGITAIRLPENGVQPETFWNARQMNPATVSPLLLGNGLFSMNAAGVLMRADAKTGDMKWKLRLTGPFSASPVGAANRALVVNEKGLVQVVDVDAPEGAVTGQLQLSLKESVKELVLSTPSLSGDLVFIRSDSTLWCLSR